ncbi:hypothetical protein [Helicobacter pylori]|uniref:hypothetical protein n=1 Tax=Helicobacter pylori TaxID=210 RepID=UPI000EB5553A|nr:hypothetical protein [Helicobacter pylori]RKV11653.1 hypothetical protein DDP48_04065 [Helicobacter pylori]WQX58716.1 hypothetical protein KVJ99_04270 [Helicobacter pylori]
MVKGLSVFSSPLISTQLRPNDYGVLISLGFDIGDFFSTKEIGNNDCDSFIFLPLNMKPTTQGTYIQAPTNENNNLNIGNDSVTIKKQKSVSGVLALNFTPKKGGSWFERWFKRY